MVELLKKKCQIYPFIETYVLFATRSFMLSFFLHGPVLRLSHTLSASFSLLQTHHHLLTLVAYQNGKLLPFMVVFQRKHKSVPFLLFFFNLGVQSYCCVHDFKADLLVLSRKLWRLSDGEDNFLLLSAFLSSLSRVELCEIPSFYVSMSLLWHWLDSHVVEISLV